MTAALILKELRQHWLAFLLLAALLAFGFLLLLGATALEDSGSVFDTLQRFLVFFVVLAALVLGNRLVVREYQSKTQLFLEGLPISRSLMVGTKYLFGLSLLLVAVTTALVLLIPVGARSESLTGQFLLIIAARSYAFTWCVYSFFFVMGLLGRYRVAIYVLGILGVAAIETQTSLEFNRFGPFALVNERFAYDRSQWPTEALLVTAGLAAALAALTFALAVTREGSLATLLAEKMSHREKIFVAALLLGFVMTISIYDEEAQKQPFDLPEAVAASVGDVTVKVSIGASPDEARGERLAQLVARETAALQAYLQLDELPPVFIVQRRDLDADRFERGELEGAEGLLVRANFLSDEWDDGRFLAWLVRELLIVASAERVKLERNMWVLDGFALYWICRHADGRLADRERLELRAAYAASQGFAARDAQSWLRYRERVGADLAQAVAWSGLVALARARGEQRCRAFLQTMLDCDVPGDVRALLHEWRHPLPAVLRRETGLAYGELMELWTGELRAAAESRAQQLASVPRPRGTVSFARISEATRMVTYRFECEPPPPRGRFALWHAELPPFDHEVPPSELRREDLQYPLQQQGDLPGSYARGTRFYATFAVWAEQLDCEIITGWTRDEME